MPDWDEDSPQLRANGIFVEEAARDAMRQRAVLSLPMLCQWHSDLMRGLSVSHQKFHPSWIGAFRGSTPENSYPVQVGGARGVEHENITAELHKFESRLQSSLLQLDNAVPAETQPENRDILDAILQLCAWAHAEWVRIHPFINGSGRTARILVNAIAVRYNLPPFLQLVPRPQSDPHGAFAADYELAAINAMHGDWKASIPMIRAYYLRSIGNRD